MFKVNQPVWCVMLGKGVVTRIINTDVTYPLVVEFPGKIKENYTLDGKYRVDARPVLFPHPVEIVKKVTKPSINWLHVRDEYKFLARSASGNAWIYSEEPTLDEGFWAAEPGVYAKANSYVSYTPGTCDWEDSLVKRPE